MKISKSYNIKRYISWLIILYIFSPVFANANYGSKFGVQNNTFKQANIDTCILSGLNFKIIEHRSGRNLHAIIKNNKIEIINNGVQYFKYRIVHYVFSGSHNDQIPTIRIFNGQIDYRILNILKHSRQGERYNFEDIIVVDKSGTRLENKVRSIIIERL